MAAPARPRGPRPRARHATRRWGLAVLAAGAVLACRFPRSVEREEPRTPASALVEAIEARGVRDARVLEAIRAVPRDRFVPETQRHLAWEDRPLPIGEGQTISAPSIVAYMAQALALHPGDRVLEVGSGSGYAAAVLSRLAAEVHGIEIEETLHARSAETLAALGYANVKLRRGDGFHGWPDAAPFDAIVISFAAPSFPEPLWAQLAEGGRAIYPEGPADGHQELVLLTRTKDGRKVERLLPVRFVPMQRE